MRTRGYRIANGPADPIKDSLGKISQVKLEPTRGLEPRTYRLLVSNGDFDAYWHYHFNQEHHRVHHTQYHGNHKLAA